MNGIPSRAVVGGNKRQRMGIAQIREGDLSLPESRQSEVVRRPSVFSSEQKRGTNDHEVRGIPY